MKKVCKPLEEPMNAQERYMHGINERLDIVIDLLVQLVPKQEVKVAAPTVVEVIDVAKVEETATKPTPNRSRKKTTTKKV